MQLSVHLRPARLFTAVILAFAGFASQAQVNSEPLESRRAAAQRLVAVLDEVTGLTRTLGKVDDMEEGTRKTLDDALRRSTHLTILQRQRAEQVLGAAFNEILGTFFQELTLQVLQAQTEAYAAKLSVAEIDAARQFLESASGRRATQVMMDEMPNLSRLVIWRVETLRVRASGRLKQAEEQLKREGISLELKR